MTQPLLPQIEQFLTASGYSEYTFGRMAAQNGRLVERLRNGDPVLTSTDAKVRAWLAANADKRSSRKRATP